MSMLIICRTAFSCRKMFAKILFAGMPFLAIVFFAQSSRAADCSPIQIGLWSSAQLIPKENAICGVRLDLLWGENTSVTGIDAGLVNVAESLKGIEIGGINWLSGHERKESWGIQIAGINYAGNSSFTGAQIGLFNAGSSRDSVTGIQAAALNLNDGDINGVQLGLGSHGTNVNGLQIGFLNEGENVNGLQAFFINNAENLNGLQIGFLNNSLGKPVRGTIHGVQIGFGNYAADMHGVQLGLILNVCDSLSGVQIGLFNIVTNRFPDKGLFFFPLINAGF